MDVLCDTCVSSPNVYSKSYTSSDKFVLTGAACTQNGTSNLITGTYTVVSGDIGTPFGVDAYAECVSSC